MLHGYTCKGVPPTNMDEVSFGVDHNIPMMPVLKPQEIRDHRVGGQGLRKVLLGGYKILNKTSKREKDEDMEPKGERYAFP